MLREFINQIEKLPQKAYSNCLQIDTEKPLIAVISAESDTNIAHKNIKNVVENVCNGILIAGGNAKVLHVPSIETNALHSTSTVKYDLPSRELVANTVETICSNEYIDAIVFVASDNNILAGMLIGALRTNIPCLFVSGGVMSPVYFNGAEHGYSHYFEQVAKIKSGATEHELLETIENTLPQVFGSDCDSYNANSMNFMLEIGGFSLEGNSTVPAGSVKHKTLALETGKLAVKIADEKLLPRRMLTMQTLCNMFTLDVSCGGSTTSVINTLALAKEVGIKTFNFGTITDIAKATPTIVNKTHGLALIPMIERAGGVYAIAKQLLDAKLIRGDVELENGKMLHEALENAAGASSVICSVSKPATNATHVKAVFGNVAEKGAIVRYGKTATFTGSAKVYDNEEMAVDALLHREVRPGDVIVIHNEGPESCPGMREVYMTFALLKGYELEDKVAVITDGRIADNFDGIAVGNITPETKAQGIFALIQDGDEIEISASKGKISVDIKSKELTQRQKDYEAPSTPTGNAFLKNWSKNVSPATEGCVFKTK